MAGTAHLRELAGQKEIAGSPLLRRTTEEVSSSTPQTIGSRDRKTTVVFRKAGILN